MSHATQDVHCSENLLKPEQYKKWLSSKATDERITCTLGLEEANLVSSIDIGNDGSAFIELLVSRSTASDPDAWTVLLPPTLLMTPSESRSSTNRNQVKLLKSTDLNQACLNQKWDRLQIVCEQKFNRVNPFGLCFIKLYSPSSVSDDVHSIESVKSTIRLGDLDDSDEGDETGKEQSKIGSFFAKKQAEKKSNIEEPSASDQIRALSNVADDLLSKQPMNDDEIQTLLNKDGRTSLNHPSKRRLSNEATSPVKENGAKRSKVDKSRLMRNVIFVLSGFQNPLRSELRSKATAMGAVCNDDWDEKCTHLICAFPNTPKFTQVQKTGHGSIVSKQWILDCYDQNQFLSEKDYQLKGAKSSSMRSDTQRRTLERKPTKISTFDDDDDEEENDEPVAVKDVQRRSHAKKKITTFDDDDDNDDDEEEEPIASKVVTRKALKRNNRTISDDDKKNAYDAETDEDEPPMAKKFHPLADLFQGKHFHVSESDFDPPALHSIRRIIYAYDGVLDKQINPHVNYVVSNRSWNEDFEKESKMNPALKFLTPDWLQDCHNEEKLLPCEPYAIEP